MPNDTIQHRDSGVPVEKSSNEPTSHGSSTWRRGVSSTKAASEDELKYTRNQVLSPEYERDYEIAQQLLKSIRVSPTPAPKEKSKSRSKKRHDSQTSKLPLHCGCSSSTDQRVEKNLNKSDRRINSSRRTRSADRVESHYTYIDAPVSGLSREVTEHAYETVPEIPNTSENMNTIHDSHLLNQNAPNYSHPVYSIPSMTSPPPTYDVAINKSSQNGLPPSYGEYLYQHYKMYERSHTPPPPWSDSTSTNNMTSPYIRQGQGRACTIHSHNTENMGFCTHALKKHVKQQKIRAMSPRSSSESRVQQRRMNEMYDGAFCMETAVITTAIENGVAFCSIM
ncbi:uncharacterized protein LOC103576388 [Microplitis demolitor]|uniref:uncharacterized protein LOC103576388 n=1 Tax=Microplitis demolitor TaxID=69319 RepID=UPI0006D4F488|nr:uncharacterized protein LOC103576388 [Microplitis demolitor]XP_014299645.1 uncharacterized protein LOC103576388 [Microplitis demolitor]